MIALRKSWTRVSGVPASDTTDIVAYASLLVNLRKGGHPPVCLVIANPWKGRYFEFQRHVSRELPFVVPIRHAFRLGASRRYLEEWRASGNRVLAPEDMLRMSWSMKRPGVFRFLRREFDGENGLAPLGMLGTARQLELFALLPELALLGGRVLYLRPTKSLRFERAGESAVSGFQSMLKGFAPLLEQAADELDSVTCDHDARIQEVVDLAEASLRARGGEPPAGADLTQTLVFLCKAVALLHGDRRVEADHVEIVAQVGSALLTDRELRCLRLLRLRGAIGSASATMWDASFRAIPSFSRAALLEPLERAGLVGTAVEGKKVKLWLREAASLQRGSCAAPQLERAS